MARRQLSELQWRGAGGVGGVKDVLELKLELDVGVGDGFMELKLVVELP